MTDTATFSFVVNDQPVQVECAPDLQVLWVLRDLLGIHGPKYGCGLDVCKACTCHLNGEAFNPCSVPISDIQPTDEITTVEGLARDGALHPMQEAWIDIDVAQCGYCQPGQIMAAIVLANDVHSQGRRVITDDDFIQIRNVCRCGTYFRIREAIQAGFDRMFPA